jgi:REP element-mobilizing transposase RayT
MRYSGHNAAIIHRLHYSWTGWPTVGSQLPENPGDQIFALLADLWARDGLTVIGRSWTADEVHFTFEATPQISPVILAGRAKGRLQHALRQAAFPAKFSRKVSVRALGENVDKVVERYVAGQVRRSDLVDCRFRQLLTDCSFHDQSVRLGEPSETNSGRYWYNLHMVLVTAGRYRMGELSFLDAMRRAGLDALAGIGCRTAQFAIMPDHLHVVVRGAVEHTPAEIALTLQNATAAVAGCCLWQEGFYVGTFGEYALSVVRER